MTEQPTSDKTRPSFRMNPIVDKLHAETFGTWKSLGISLWILGSFVGILIAVIALAIYLL